MTVLASRTVSPFEKKATTTMKRLQSALARVIESVPEDIRRAADLERAIEIPRNLAWQVFTIANSRNPLADGTKVPGQFAMQRFIEAAGRVGVPERRLREARSALSAFDDVVASHAGDRGAFSSMVSGLTEKDNGLIDLQQRRAAFKAQSHIWGLQADTHLTIAMFHPTADTQFSAVYIRGLIELRWLRRDAPWIVSRVHPPDGSGAIREDSFAAEPLDAESETVPGISPIRQFCSRPLPRFLEVLPHSDLINVELEKTGLGKASAMTCIFGNLHRNAGSRFCEQDRTQQIEQALVRVPCRVLVRDILIHEGLFGRISPEVTVFGDQRGGNLTPSSRPCDRLPMREAVVNLGAGRSAWQIAEVPQYAEMIRYACDRLGWNPEDFEVWRCRVEYPVMPSSVVVQFDLPEKPGGQ